MPEKSVFKAVTQVGLVVKNLDEAVKKYWEVFGIGPWAIFTMDGSSIHDMTIRNERKDSAFRVAFADMGNLQWELIQPLDEKSIYSEFLEKHGEGLHHVAFSTNNGFEETLELLKGKGVDVLTSGRANNGVSFANLDTEATLSCISEIHDVPENMEQAPPETTYP